MMLKWKKLGRVYEPRAEYAWCRTHAQLPIVDQGIVDGKTRKVYFSSRDKNGISRGGCGSLIKRSDDWFFQPESEPILDIGSPGTFDDCGVMPTSVLNVDGVIHLYYIGWNVRNTVPYHNSIGLARYNEQLQSFEKVSQGPLFDRNPEEPFFSGTANVLYHLDRWHMWYLSCTEWLNIDGKMEPRYLIRYADSDDGVRWRRTGRVSIPYKHEYEAIAGASVVQLNDGSFLMMYSYRNISNYRSSGDGSYCLGYALSADGVHWERKDGLIWETEETPSEEDWDAQMQAYPNLFWDDGALYMLYNGNGFGQSGFGIAKGLING